MAPVEVLGVVGEGRDGKGARVGDQPGVMLPLVDLRNGVIVAADCHGRLAATVGGLATADLGGNSIDSGQL